MNGHMTWDIKLWFNTDWYDGNHLAMHVQLQLEERYFACKYITLDSQPILVIKFRMYIYVYIRVCASVCVILQDASLCSNVYFNLQNHH